MIRVIITHFHPLQSLIILKNSILENFQPLKPNNNSYKLCCFLFIIFLSIVACSSSPDTKLDFLKNNKSEVNYDEISSFFDWSTVLVSPEKTRSTGFIVPITPVESEEKWQKIDKENTKGCPNADFNFYFAKAFYKKWENLIEIKYCFREGNPESNSFQIYYLPIVELEIENQKEADNISIYLTRQNTYKYKNQDQQARNLKRLLFIANENRLHLINLTDIHPYLSKDAIEFMSSKTGGNNSLRGNQLYWRNIHPAEIRKGFCKVNNSLENSLDYRTTILREYDVIKPRTSCFTLDNTSKFSIGFANSGDIGNAGYLLLKKDSELAIHEITYSGLVKFVSKAQITTNTP